MSVSNQYSIISYIHHNVSCAEESRKSLAFSTMSKVGSVNKTKSSLITSLKNLGHEIAYLYILKNHVMFYYYKKYIISANSNEKYGINVC